MKPRTEQTGFTLIEVVVSLMVATIGIAGVMGLSGWLIRASSWVDHTRQASLMAEGAFEEIRALDYDSIISGSDVVNGYTRDWTVTTSGNTKIVDIQVGWNGLEGGRRQLELRSLKAQPATRGVHFLQL